MFRMVLRYFCNELILRDCEKPAFHAICLFHAFHAICLFYRIKAHAAASSVGRRRICQPIAFPYRRISIRSMRFDARGHSAALKKSLDRGAFLQSATALFKAFRFVTFCACVTRFGTDSKRRRSPTHCPQLMVPNSWSPT